MSDPLGVLAPANTNTASLLRDIRSCPMMTMVMMMLDDYHDDDYDRDDAR